jgi:hypothetical protein
VGYKRVMRVVFFRHRSKTPGFWQKIHSSPPAGLSHFFRFVKAPNEAEYLEYP